MFFLTYRERKIVIGIATLVLLGSVMLFFGFSVFQYTPADKAAGESPQPVNQPLININTASSEELQALPGIGTTIASRIIEYRNLHGPFQNSDELLSIKGIGEQKLRTMKAYILF